MNDLVQIAIAAFRAGRYQDAIELLQQVTDSDAKNYLAQLYLAMAYEKAGHIADAQRLVKRLAAECFDPSIQHKALLMLPLLEAEMRRRFTKQPTKKDAASKSNDADDIVWVG